MGVNNLLILRVLCNPPDLPLNPLHLPLRSPDSNLISTVLGKRNCDEFLLAEDGVEGRTVLTQDRGVKGGGDGETGGGEIVELSGEGSEEVPDGCDW